MRTKSIDVDMTNCFFIQSFFLSKCMRVKKTAMLLQFDVAKLMFFP